MSVSFCSSLRSPSSWAAIVGLLGVMVACSKAAAFEPAPQDHADSSPCDTPPATDNHTAASVATAEVVKPPPWLKQQNSGLLRFTSGNRSKFARGVERRHVMLAALGLALVSIIIRCIWVSGQMLASCFTSFWTATTANPQKAVAEVQHAPPQPVAILKQEEAPQEGGVTSPPLIQDEEDELLDLVWADLGGLLHEPPSGSKPSERQQPEETGRVSPGQRRSWGLVISRDPAFMSEDPSPQHSFLRVFRDWPPPDLLTADRPLQGWAHDEQRSDLGVAADAQPQERGGLNSQAFHEGTPDVESSEDFGRPPAGAAPAGADAAVTPRRGEGFGAPGSPWIPLGAQGRSAPPVGGWGRRAQPFYGVPQGEPYSQQALTPQSPALQSPFDFGFFGASTPALSPSSGGDDEDSTTS
ncbi:hypothetical protein ACSSS7_004684 [Eimeria intestinalis]